MKPDMERWLQRGRILRRRVLSKRFIVLVTFIAAISFGVGTIVSQVLPKAKSWLMVTIDSFSRDNLPVRILPTAVDFRLLPLGVTIHEVRIIPSPSVDHILSPIFIRELTVDLSLLQIVRGEVGLDRVSVKGADIKVTIPHTPKSSGKPLEGLFAALNKVPIDTVEIEEVDAEIDIEGSTKKDRVTLDLDQVRAQFERGRRSFSLSLSADSVLVADHAEDRALRITPDLALVVTPTSIDVERLEIRRGSSLVQLEGQVKGDTEGLKFDVGAIEGEIDLDVKSTRDWLQKSIRGAEPTPPMDGRLNTKFNLSKKNAGAPWLADFDLSTEKYRVQGILVDKIKFAGKWDGKSIIIPSGTANARASQLEVTDIRIGEGAEKVKDSHGQERTPWLLRANKIKASLELHEFMEDMGLGKIPVWLTGQGEFSCESEIIPNFIFRCGGALDAQNTIVRGDMKAGRQAAGAIAAIPTFSAKGSMVFDLEKVHYDADIKMPQSKGSSSGDVFYLTGFDIQYDAEKFAISDLASLGGLKLEGLLKLNGSTKGDSQAATFSMTAEGQNLWFEDFWLGQPRAQVNYKSGTLSFNGIQGYYTTSRYNGDVAVDLTKSRIETQMRVPFFDAKDLLQVFSRKFKLPFVVTGTGQASIKANGPLGLAYLSYDLKSSLFKGMIAGENFDQVHFDVKSKDGEVRSERVMMTRGDAAMQLTGEGHPNGHIEAIVKGTGIKIEETNFVSQSGFALQGVVGFDMNLNGPVLAPDAEMKGTLSKTAIAETSVPDSAFQMKFRAKTVEGSGNLLGDLVTANFVVPLDPDAPFSLKFQSREWNFAPLFAAVAGPTSRKDFEGRLTSKIDIQAPRGGFWAATGSAQIDRLSLRRGSIRLANDKTIYLDFKDGNITPRDFEVLGDDTFIRISPADSPTRKFDVSINSKVDMNLLSIFTPFFEEMRGLLSMAVSLKVGPEGSDMIGSAFIDRAFLKFANFVHPFENIQSDLVFNHKKIVVNSLKSDFAGGRIQASGNVEIRDKKNYPVNISGTMEKVTLNVPEGIKTSGSGDFTFTGSWFPFLLKGGYVVRDGLMSKEFGGGDAAEEALRREQFLPRFLLEENFIPLLVDVNIDLTKGMQLRNEMVDGFAAGNLRVSGNPAKPTLEGQMRTTGETKIMFRGNTFDVTNSVFVFDDPLEINPKINLNANTRVSQYDVALTLQGTAKKPKISVSSVPPMSESDILSLLALGETDTNLNQKVGTNSQSNATGQQVVSSVANTLVKGATKDLGFEVQLSPGFDKSGEAYQRVTVKKQFSRKLNISGSQTMGTKKGQTDLKVQYRITDRVSTTAGWENGTSETNDSNGQVAPVRDKYGLDFEYRFEFK